MLGSKTVQPGEKGGGRGKDRKEVRTTVYVILAKQLKRKDDEQEFCTGGSSQQSVEGRSTKK